MSLFGTSFPASTTKSGLSTSWNIFGTPSTAAVATQQPNIFGSFASPFSTSGAISTTAASQGIASNFTGFGQQQTQAQAQPLAAPTAGLGGARADTSLAGTHVTASSQRTPKETEIPPEITAVVNALKEKIKENRDMSEEIAAFDSKMLGQLDTSYRSALVDCSKAAGGVQKMAQAVSLLKAESRQDLLDGEMAQRLRDSLAINFEYAAPLNLLLRLVSNYEKLLVAYAEELQRLEKLIFGQQKSVTSEDIATHLKRVDGLFRYVSTKVYELNNKLQEVKDSFKDYRRSVYGDAVRFFPSTSPSRNTPLKRIEGPSPFSMSSHNAMLVIANALSRAQAGTGLAPNIALPVQQTYGTQPLTGFGIQQPQLQQPLTMAQPLFRPFGASSMATSATTSVTPFASGTLSFASPLGATTVTTTTSMTTSTAASPWRFSSPFNTSSSGTLFGGTATNVGAVKPLGLATPLQQGGSPATTSLQLLNPPLGSKRGKS